MKTVILCGGLGSRLGEATRNMPKPMVHIGPIPIIEHIMLIYKKYGYEDFILAGGYKYQIIQKYFKNHKKFKHIKVINTGKGSLTGLRLFKLKKYLRGEKNFMLTYGDGLIDQNINKLVKFHFKHKNVATVTAVRPPVRFGELNLNYNKVKSFAEKPQAKHGWINGGFFVFNKKIFNFLTNKNVMLETEPMNELVKKKQLIAYKHYGFWQCMDTVREKNFLNSLYKKKKNFW
jgi:glucose-1-phosphate cytidylyltransferase